MAWNEKYCTPTGAGAHDGSSEANAWTLLEAEAGAVAGDRVNVKAGTHALGTTSLTFDVDATTTQPIWWRGYATTIGDLDDDDATAKPLVEFTGTTARASLSGDHHRFSNLSFKAATTAGACFTVTSAALASEFGRCRFEATAANSASRAFTDSGRATATRCWFKSTSSAIVVILGPDARFLGNRVEGGLDGVQAGVSATILFNVISGCARYGVDASAVDSVIVNNSIYGCTTAGINFTTLSAASPTLVANNVIEGCPEGVRNSSGTATNFIKRLANSYYNCTTANEVGFGDTVDPEILTESASPFTAAGSADFTLLSTATSKASGVPGRFENSSFTGYLDRGAVQRQEAGGGASLDPGDVRLGVDMGGGDTGTCVVPAASDVWPGVAVDDAVGTLVIEVVPLIKKGS